MKKFLTSAVFILVFCAYALNQYLGGATPTVAASAGTAATQTATSADIASSQPAPSPVASDPQPTAQPAPIPKPTPTPAPAPKPRGQYVDGTYTGSPADAYYGTVQIAVTVSGGKISSVSFLQYPNDRSTSRMINGQAMPMLQSQAIAVQNANVDGVSGATDTSGAFIQSLSSALAQAKA